MKCLIEGCDNHTGEGMFIGPLCAPHHRLYSHSIDMGAYTHHLKEGISDSVHNLVDEMMRGVDDDTEDVVRTQLTEEFRFWRRNV